MKEDSIERWVKKAIRGNVDAYGQLVELYKIIFISKWPGFMCEMKIWLSTSCREHS